MWLLRTMEGTVSVADYSCVHVALEQTGMQDWKSSLGQVQYCLNTWYLYNIPVVFVHNLDIKQKWFMKFSQNWYIFLTLIESHFPNITCPHSHLSCSQKSAVPVIQQMLPEKACFPLSVQWNGIYVRCTEEAGLGREGFCPLSPSWWTKQNTGTLTSWL